MSAWPMDLVKGRRSVTTEQHEVDGKIADLQQQISDIQAKVFDRKTLLFSIGMLFFQLTVFLQLL